MNSAFVNTSILIILIYAIKEFFFEYPYSFSFSPYFKKKEMKEKKKKKCKHGEHIGQQLLLKSLRSQRSACRFFFLVVIITNIFLRYSGI